MRKSRYPILEFDPARQSVIEPHRLLQPADVPEHCVLCFFQEVIDQLHEVGQARPIHALRSEMGAHPLYELDVQGQRLGLFHPGLGGPMAGALLDELIALGVLKVIACGGAGVLDRQIAAGHLLVPVSAVRDEGTSYHYLPPAREAAPSPAGVAALVKTLESHGVPHLLVKTWTTDAFYRETPAKVQLRRREGCLAVEMEAASFFAVAQFRGVTLAQLLYGGDDVSGTDWDPRRWAGRAATRESVFWLAAEACLSL